MGGRIHLVFLEGKAEGTVGAYVRILRQFLSWLLEKPGGSAEFRPDQFTRTAVSTYIKELENNRISVSHSVRVKSALS
ncbi:phage integrase N-terminal SAM-like domain-containing protein [Paenibacillus polymyxa]|uniref:phage integrase N-terminal SAM-like domain-containing protein n=1 Tax=Paenibacillus polymyxa TaxID=1406 RepID=UPI002025907A|nr:phage integrase N-terminal SAM-like domain-containing protein [Paenibacillus polymyxa]MDU8672530.1 phage integrase N-terminal SAM-like domain-containing protein [Paenibacillus polymyxa]MDU8697437.1 phage integrase N-terminal SAM-like domain-containing protein [Paenibacillus polymyxa]URJ56602.3 phage integrase N-terminal SAM-like domain-containing protein [Paenibacillus polymyxa]URJ64032.1 phage integrase N-terminal SAM-like domain-containing protein [Paenibacillus polymyxa]URJ71110.1 phage 